MWWGSRLLQKYCNLRYWIIQATGIWETAGKAGFSDFALKQVIKPSGERSLPIPGERSKLQKRQGEGSEFISHVVSPRLPHLVHTLRILFSFSLFFILLLLLFIFFFFLLFHDFPFFVKSRIQTFQFNCFFRSNFLMKTLCHQKSMQ